MVSPIRIFYYLIFVLIILLFVLCKSKKIKWLSLREEDYISPIVTGAIGGLIVAGITGSLISDKITLFILITIIIAMFKIRRK